jgi:hypothetical protein
MHCGLQSNPKPSSPAIEERQGTRVRTQARPSTITNSERSRFGAETLKRRKRRIATNAARPAVAARA